MRSSLGRIARLGVGVLLVAACAGREDTSPVAPSFDVASTTHTISGQVLGPDGMSICNTLPGDVTVDVIDPVSGFFTSQGGLCTAATGNGYSILVPAGTYRVRARGPFAPFNIGQLPFRWLEPGDVVVGGGDVTKDIQWLNGTPLGGGVMLDGAPITDVAFDLVYDFQSPSQLFRAAFGISGADGHWKDQFVDRSPMTVQEGVRYRTVGCAALGARMTSLLPSAFLFPTDASAVNCTLVTGASTTFSHTLTRLVVTPMTGDIGGQSPELVDQYGLGWGVQFPVTPPAAPRHAAVSLSRLFRGGLVVGIAPDVVLAGFDYFDGDCGASCRDFGLDGTVTVKDKGSAGKRVTWHYSDATSLEHVGLQVVQHSFDGQPPNDYVLLQFIFTNTSTSTLTFHAGFYGDWDLWDDNDARNDVGFTDLGRKLMYVTNSGSVGVHVGTMLLGDFPISGTYFVGTGSHLSLTDQVNALRGAITQTSLGPTDIRYFHSVGPITLKPSKKTVEIWIAIVAGENKAQLLANAAAAQADVASQK